MKRLLFSIVCLLSFSGALFSQGSETFDIATFQPPTGWKKQNKNAVVIFNTSNEQKGSYAMITLYASGASSGNAKSDFEDDWREFIAAQLAVKAKPEIEPAKTADGWTIITGGAAFENNLGAAVVLMNTYSGHGRVFSAAVIFNSPDYAPAIEAFASSIQLKKPEPGELKSVSKQQETTDTQSGSQPALAQFYWKKSQTRKDIGGYAGYSANTYKFNSNNTYKFSRVDFQNYSPKYYLEDEEGTYRISGNTITLIPKKGVFHNHKSKKEDPPLRSGNLQLTTVQYSFEIINLNNNWTLLLSPVDGTETKRDGVFGFWLNGKPTKAYSYNSVNAQGELIR